VLSDRELVRAAGDVGALGLLRHVTEAAGFTQADTITDGNGTKFIRYTRRLR
jgi:hypothetical protein